MLTTVLALVLAANAATAPAPAVTEIAPGVHLLRGHYGAGQPDGNSIVLDGKGGLVIVDTGRHQTHTRALLDYATARKLPILAVINTHWHLDHTGGNVLIRKEAPKVKVYASGAIDDALKGFLANYAGQLKGAIAKAAEGSEEQRSYQTELGLIESGRLAPDEVIASSGARSFAGRQLDVHLEPFTVTAGDLWLVDQKTGTLIAGDLITVPFPFLDTACPQHWKEALKKLSEAKFERIIPGHGTPMTREDLARYRTAFDNLLACGASKQTNEQCATGWLTDAKPFLAGTDEKFLRAALDYYLDGFLRPGAATAKLCGM